MTINRMFWDIIGLGTAIPFTLIIIINLSIKAKVGDQYQLQFYKLSLIYFIALLGWAIFFGIGLGR